MKLIVLVFALFQSILIFSQTSINGKVLAGDSIQISISSVVPLEFSEIEVLFRAEDLSKYPYWGLEKEDLKVSENDLMCNVISLRHFSESEPINISIVMDHSGSMSYSYQDLLDFYDNDSTKMFDAWLNGSSPDIKSPLDNAATAVKQFLENFENDKDRIGLFAFDDTVGTQIEPTQNLAEITQILDSLKPTGSTAFFDAVYLALKSLTELKGINVVIALTDGQDNASKLYSSDVISLAKENKIPVYCIGLGDAMTDTLQMLADSTGGYYAYTKKSSALDSIYDLMNRKILAYYLMTYDSPNWSSLDIDRALKIEFNQPDIYYQDNYQQFELPDEVIAYLKEKEDQERREFQYLIGGLAGGTILILGLTAFIVRRRRKKMQILRLYPNPGDGNVTVQIELGSNESANLIVRRLSGNEVYKQSFSENNSFSIDLTHLSKGNYVFVLETKTEKSQSKKYIKL